jgi:hypothetical protein
LTVFSTDWLRFFSDRQRLQIEVVRDPIVRALDLSIGILSLFGEQPVSMLGLNRVVHLQLQTIEKWHLLGDLLAPKEAWGEDLVLNNGDRWAGLRSITMEWPRREPPGFTRMTVEPSAQISRGVFVASNDHYELRSSDGRAVPAAAAIDLIRDRWGASMEFADKVRKQLMGKVT